MFSGKSNKLTIYPRLKNLYKLIRILYESNMFDIGRLRIINQIVLNRYFFVFNSNMGITEGSISKHVYNNEYFIYDLVYHGVDGKKLFHIEVDEKGGVKVNPIMMRNIGINSHDVDMAIYEIEEYLRNEGYVLEDIITYNEQEIERLR